MSEVGTTGYCHKCKRPLTEVHNRAASFLRGCMTCNIWWSPSGAKVQVRGK